MTAILLAIGALTASLPASAPADAANWEFHWPHDTVASVAVAPLPGGGRVVTIILSTGGDARVLWSVNDGLRWNVLAGEGLQEAYARELVWFADQPGGGSGHVLIATDRGVWAWDPVLDRLERFDQGLPVDDLATVALDAPAAGTGGPAVLLSGRGKVFTRAPGAPAWNLSLDTGRSTPMSLADVAVVAQYDPQAPAGPRRSLAASAAGQLYLSDDGGTQWTLHSQFSSPAAAMGDWLLPALAFADDFASGGDMVLGGARLVSGGSEGTLWHSSDGGATFTRVRDLPSAVLEIADAPAAPNGQRHLYAAARGMPGSVDPVSGQRHPGVLRSSDGGATWDDHQTSRDMFLETQDESGLTSYRYRQGISVSPTFGVDGRLYYGRHEGLFQSLDAGLYWRQRQVRSERDHRGLAAVHDAVGDTVLVGAAYGSGLIVQRVQQGRTELPDLGCEMPPTRWSDVSPNYAVDGTVLLAGGRELLCWYDPMVPPANPFGAQGWHELPLRDPVSGERLVEFVQRVAFSPHYDGRGVPGSDQSFFWTQGPDGGAFRTVDGGVTAEHLDALVGGGAAPQMRSLAVAPTYHGSSNSQDVYAVAGATLYRLEGSQWRPIWNAGEETKAVAVDPAYSRPANPTLYVLLKHAPYVVEIVDAASGVQSTPLGAGLDGAAPQWLQVPPDYAQRPVLYLATWGSGVMRMDRSASQPQWTTMGTGFPNGWCKSLALSPDFVQDRKIYAGTFHGVHAATDAPNSVWRSLTGRSLRDDTDGSSFMTYSPGDPRNTEPTHAWPWRGIWRTVLPGPLDGLAFGDGMALADYDGDYLTTTGVAEELRLWTVAGPGTGTVTIEAFAYGTGQLVGSVTVDLGQLPALDHHQVALTLPGMHALDVRVSVTLDPGEVVPFDALEFVGGA